MGQAIPIFWIYFCFPAVPISGVLFCHAEYPIFSGSLCSAVEFPYSDFTPLAFELGFGSREALAPVLLQQQDMTLRISGKVDRVDGWEQGDKLYLRVVDYKTGKKAFDLADVRYGLNLQMLLYLFTLQKQGKEYFGKEIKK